MPSNSRLTYPQKSLDLEGSQIIFESLNQQLQKLTDYEGLSITDCHSLKPDDLTKLLSGNNLGSLTHLRFNCCLGVNDDALQQLSQASSLKNLRSLDFARCRWFTNVGLQAILHSPIASQIKELNLSKCDCVNDDTLRIIGSSPSLRNLETLVLAKCYDITSQGMKAFVLSENASMLKTLDLSECWRIKDDAFTEMSNSSYLKNVERLYLTGLNYLTNHGIHEIVFSPNFEQLKTLVVANCFLLDDTAIKCIADSTNLANLEELNLNYNSKITSTGIEYLWESRNLLSIKALHLKYIYLSLRADKAMALSTQFPLLERLSLNSNGLKHFMASENIDELCEIHYGPSIDFPDDFDIYDKDDTRAKKVILEKDFPYELNLPVFRNINVLCLSLPNLTDETFHMLLAHSFESTLTTVRLHNLRLVSEFALKSLLSSNDLMGNVKSLELKSIANLSNQCLKVFSKNKTVKLTELRIKGDLEYTQSLRLDASGLSSLILSPVCTNLKTLELKHLKLEEDILKYIAISDDMANLERLILDGNFQEQTPSAAKDQMQAFKIFFGNQSKLKSLQILSLRDCPALTSKALEEIYRAYKSSKNLPALETINIDSSDAMNPTLLQKILASNPNLALNPRLRLKNFENSSLKLNFDELFRLCSSNSQLLLIELSNIDFLKDKHLGNLVEVEAINSLRTLKLRDLPSIDGSFLTQWAQPEHTSKFIYLQKIHLTDLRNFKISGLVTFIAQTNLEGLTKLEIKACPFVGDDFLQALAGSPTIKRLHRLVLAKLIGVTDAGISTILNSQVSNNLRILELSDLRNLHAETLEVIAHSKYLEKLLTLKIINCQQIDSSWSTVLFDSTLLTSLANLVFDSPIIPNDTFLKSFVFTKLRNLVHFSLNFTGDFPRDGILELLRKPNVHMKHIVLSELVGKNLETIVNDDLIELLIKSDFIDLCLSLNVNDKIEIHRISAEKLLNVAQNSEFSLEKFLQNYGGLIDDSLLVKMGQWEIPDEDYWRRKVLLKKVDSKETPKDTPKTRKSRRDSSRRGSVESPTRKGFILKIQDNYERENTPKPDAEVKEGPKVINFFAHLPPNYNFNALRKVTSEGIARIIEFLPAELDIVTFMKEHQDILDDKIFAELIKKDSFQNLTTLPFDKFKLLTKESHKLLYKSNNRFFFAKMFEFTKPLKYKLDYEILSSVAKSKELLNVEVIKVSKANLEMNCFDGLKEIFQSEFNDNVRKITFMDIYATQLSSELIKETNNLKKLEAITIKNAGNDVYAYGLKSLIFSRKFAQIRNLHLHKCTLTPILFEALANSHYIQDLTQIYLNKCIDENFLIQFSKLKNLKKLTELKLKNMFMPLEFFENIKTSNLPLESLTLYQIKLTKGTGDILALLSHMPNAKIKKLILDGIKISAKTIDAMNNSEVFKDLQSLVLSDTTIKTNQPKGTNNVGMRDLAIRSKRYSSARQMTQKLFMNEDLSLVDFNKLMNSKFINHISELKLLYLNLNDEWIECMVDSQKLSNLTSLEFHWECNISAIGIAMIIESKKKLFQQLDLSLFLEKNSKFVDDALILYLSKQQKLHYLNKLSMDNEKITSEGLISMLGKLDLKANSKFSLADFLFKVKDKVNDKVFEALSEPSFASVLKNLDLTLFKSVKEKSIYKLRIMMIDSEDKMNQLLREIPHIVDDDFIETICRCSLLNQPSNSEAKIVNIKLDAGLHRKVTSRGLNNLIQKMCGNRFTVYHDWILLEDYWRCLLNHETLSLIANDSICRPESLDLVNELDFEHNYYISTNGYQHLIRKELKSFQYGQDLAEKDRYLFVDTEDFLQRLNQNRFRSERIKIDDAIGECLLRIIAKCRHLKKINLKNKNFGDIFFRNLSVLLCKNSLHFLEEMNFCDNPRLTSTGLKYLYTAIVGNDTIKRIYLSCNPDLQSDVNTIVDDGLYIFTKKKVLEITGPAPRKIDHVFIFMCLYMIVAFPLAIWQYYEDRILKSKRVAQIKSVIVLLEKPFIKPKKKRHMSILPISETLIPHYNETLRKKAEKVLQENHETIVPAENFYFTKNAIKLNEALKNSKVIFWIFFLNFVIHHIVSIAVPLLFNGDGCQTGLVALGFVIYGIYAFGIFLFETLFYRFMTKTLADNRALQFGLHSIVHLICSQTAKFDLFTDVIFVVNLYSCQDTDLAIAATVIVVISVLFNVIGTLMTTYSLWRGKNPHFSSHINRYAKLSLSTELHAIGHALDKFSTSNCVKWGNVYMPQIMVTAIGKFTLEDFPQFILQLLKIFVFSRGQANVGLTLASTLLSLIMSFRTAMKARPSVCKAEHVEHLIKADGRRVGQTDLLEEKDSGELSTPTLSKEKTSSKLSGDEAEESLLARLQISQTTRKPEKGIDVELSQVDSQGTLSEESESDRGV